MIIRIFAIHLYSKVLIINNAPLRETGDFEQFFRSNYTRTYYLAFSILHDEEASKDVVADSFELLFQTKNMKKLEVQELRNYLYMMVRNKCADYFRKQSIHDEFSEYVLRSTETATNDDWLEHEEKVKMVSDAMKQLSPRTQQILNEHYLKNKKYREVAAELDISESAVKKHVMQALSFFRKKFVKE